MAEVWFSLVRPDLVRLGSAHLLARGARRQDVELGQLGRVLLSLEPEGRNAGGATVGSGGR